MMLGLAYEHGRLRGRVAVALMASGLFAGSALATRWTLVDFGSSDGTTTTPYPGWTQVIRHAANTEFVDPDGNPNHAGVADVDGLAEGAPSYCGVRGSTPIHLARGNEIVVTVYNRSDYSPYPTMRVSFSDSDEPSPEEPEFPWFTIYNVDYAINTEWVPPYTLFEMHYYIQPPDMVAAIDGVASTGACYVVNVNNVYHDSACVITKIELTDEADLTPPLPPTNLRVQWASSSGGIISNIVKLIWSPASDPAPHATGVDRYYVYRDGELYDVVSREMAEHLGDELIYLDTGVGPNEVHAYAVSAIDKAQYGLYPTADRLPCHPANQSPLSAPLVVTSGSWRASSLVNPWTDLQYVGGFRLPLTGDETWSYASGGLTYYPDGNSGYDPEHELRGCLYAMSQTQQGVGSFSIPIPSASSNPADWPHATTLIPATTAVFPLIYDGNAYPGGGGGFAIGDILYHPGGNGVSGRLYYSLCNFYDTEPDAPSHGWMDLALTAGHGAWHIGAVPPGNIYPGTTARYMCRIPQAWADAHTGGRSLLIGNNFLSGGLENYNGPTIYAVSPWETGALPASGGALPATLMLRYSPIGTVEHRIMNWRIDRFAEGATWLEFNGKSALAISYRRPMGDTWYGDTAGNNFTFYNIPEPPMGEEGAGATCFRNEFMFYNPDDLAAVVNGDQESWQPQPYATYDIQRFSFATNEIRPQSGAICYAGEIGYLFYIEHNGDPTDEWGTPYALVHAWRVGGPYRPTVAVENEGRDLRLAWATAADGRHYQPQRTADLRSTNWTDFGEATRGDGSNKTCSVDVSTVPEAYFRIRVSE